METLFVIYAAAAAFVATVLSVLLAVGAIRTRRRSNRIAVLGVRYLHIVVLALMSGEGPAPRFPLIRRMGGRLLLARTIAGLVSVTYGLDPTPLRHIVERYGLDEWILRRVERSQGYRRARYLSLLTAMPVSEGVAARAGKYRSSRNRYVRFSALMIQLSADPATALRLLSEYEHPLSACEVSEIMTGLRRGMLPVAYEPLVLSPNRNLRKVGLGIIRQFGIEEAEDYLLRIVANDSVPELGREAVYTLCSLKRPLAGHEIADRIASMEPQERRALLRYMAQEGYSSGTLRKLLDASEQPYYESLVQSYKRCLA